MQRKNSETKWSGYGSTYTRGKKGEGIEAVLGGQIWKIRPDEKEKLNNPCIWMQAGVVKRKSCTNFYDCVTCKYDKAMQKKAREGKHPSWQDAMRMREPMGRICRHTLTNRIPHRLCAYDYRCETCDFDQYFEDTLNLKSGGYVKESFNIKGFELPVGYYFHTGHTWARIESGGFIRIGMDDFSLKLLGEMDGFELPVMGKVVEHAEPSWGIKRRDKEADVLSPVGGIVVEVNSRVREYPTLANKRPYEDGWLFLVRTNDIKESMRRLMDDNTSTSWLNEEISTLEKMVEEVAGPLAADGGVFGEDIYGNLPSLGWERLTKTFLRTP